MQISKRLRFEILRRDGFKCVYCGKQASESELHVDHVIPIALGGDEAPGNLVACCIDCNIGKSSTSAEPSITPLPDHVISAVVEAAEMRAKREEALAYENKLIEALQEDFRSYWQHPSIWPYSAAVRSWLREFTFTEIQDFIEIACLKCRDQKGAVRYLAGIVRGKRSDREEGRP